MNDHERPEPDPRLHPGPEQEEQEDATPQEGPAGLDYVFKIAPADPKNSFDFEDVADK